MFVPTRHLVACTNRWTFVQTLSYTKCAQPRSLIRAAFLAVTETQHAYLFTPKTKIRQADGHLHAVVACCTVVFFKFSSFGFSFESYNYDFGGSKFHRVACFADIVLLEKVYYRERGGGVSPPLVLSSFFPVSRLV